MADQAKFLLEISLGNAEMASGRDVAGALREVAELIEDEEWAEPMLMDTAATRKILDVNGASVGRWAVKFLSEEQVARQVAW